MADCLMTRRGGQAWQMQTISLTVPHQQYGSAEVCTLDRTPHVWIAGINNQPKTCAVYWDGQTLTRLSAVDYIWFEAAGATLKLYQSYMVPAQCTCYVI